jgi:hypothetical protein
MKGYRHCYPTIAYLLSQSAEDFKKSYPEDTEKMREELIKLRDKGFTAIPCDHSDPKTGECLGHERPEKR